MTDTGWGDEGEAAGPAKKRIPTWAWWTCGGGCLVLTVIAIVMAFFTLRVASEFLDPEQAWEGVREVLPHDQRPEGWKAHGVSLFGVGNYFLAPPEPGVLVVVQRFRRAPELEALFDPESLQNGGLMAFQEIRTPELGTLELQGREVRTLRFLGGVPENPFGIATGGPSIRLDLSLEERSALVQISLGEGADPPSAQRVAELLAPFDLWRTR